jgi:hypothetical protein
MNTMALISNAQCREALDPRTSSRDHPTYRQYWFSGTISAIAASGSLHVASVGCTESTRAFTGILTVSGDRNINVVKGSLTIFLFREVNPIKDSHHHTRLLLEFAALVPQFLHQGVNSLIGGLHDEHRYTSRRMASFSRATLISSSSAGSIIWWVSSLSLTWTLPYA